MKKFFLICCLLVFVLIICFPQSSLESAKNAVVLCTNIVIPSLFPFIVCSNLLISLGGAAYLTRFASKIMMPVFKVQGSGALALVLGLLSGYPCGAVTVSSLYLSGSLSENEAHRLLSFTNNSGPLFIISAVGIGVYKSVSAGVILYISHLLSALTVGVFTAFFAKKEKSISTIKSATFPSAASAVPSSVQSILNLCGYIIFFSVLQSLLRKSGIFIVAENFLQLLHISPSCATLITSGLLEITGAVSSAKCTFLPATAAVISMGGISVLFQTMSIIRGCNLSIKPYIMGKFFAGGFSAFYTSLILKFFPVSVSVFSHSASPMVPAFYVSYLTAFMLSLAVFLVFYIKLLPQDGR